MAATSPDVAVVGHFSADSIKLPSNAKPYPILGGAAAYVSLSARQLDASAMVISKVGADFPKTYLKRLRGEGVDVTHVIKTPEEATTSFELTYNQDLSSRTLRLRRHGSPILPSELPRFLHAKAVHVAPIADEISFEVVAQLKSCGDLLCCDPQGMTRRFDADGNVACCAQLDRRILPLVDVFKCSVDEIKVLTDKSELNQAINAVHDFGPKIVIATMGTAGSVFSVQNEIRRVPACESMRVVDPTGAGDAFMGGFLAEYTRKKDLFWCACVGSASASLVVEDVGTRFFGDKAEIYRRARVVYEKEIKQ
ncbi:MAG: carbohydrate kinase family protein [Candidatus Bathyarchaeota archaeon]|nr:carbohydrate kinase family protein [Candidatus Bathyarchaeota archaeon]